MSVPSRSDARRLGSLLGRHGLMIGGAVLVSWFSVPARSAPGDMDPTFGNGGKVVTNLGANDGIMAMALQADEKIVVAGYTGTVFDTGFGVVSTYNFGVARYTTSGTLDPTFGSGGKVITPIGSGDDQPSGVALQSDGKIVVVGRSHNGSDSDFALVRYTSNGVLDPDFGTGGIVTTDFAASDDYGAAVVVQSDGCIVVTGTTGTEANFQFALARYTRAGALDATFGSGGKVVTSIGGGPAFSQNVVLPGDGKIVVAGVARLANRDFALVRFRTNGDLDVDFGSGGIVTTPIGTNDDICSGLALQRDGKIVLSGYAITGTNGFDSAVARYNSTGALDMSFGNGGKVRTTLSAGNDAGRSVGVQRDGKIVVAGYSGNGSNDNFALVRYTSSGVLDQSFGGDGKVFTEFGALDRGWCVAVQSDGRIIVAGFSGGFPNNNFALGRYQGGSPGDSDSDGLLDAWELTYWPTVSGHYALDDCDGDGVCELLEKAFALNPTVPDAAGLPQPGNESGYLTLTISKQPGVSYEVQSAGTLLTGRPDSFSPLTTTVLINDSNTLKVRDNVFTGTPGARFLRVQVTASP